MDIPSEKYKLLEWLLSLEDEAVISEVKALRKKHSSGPQEYGNLSEVETLFLEAGLKDLEEVRTHSHEEVLREIMEVMIGVTLGSYRLGIGPIPLIFL